MNPEQKDFITSMQTTGVTQAEAFGFYDSLESVSAKFMLGVWKGGECRTSHIMDGMLTIAPWYSKVYNNLPLSKCGYVEHELDTASPDDMLAYYPKEKQEKYKVVGIDIELR